MAIFTFLPESRPYLAHFALVPVAWVGTGPKKIFSTVTKGIIISLEESVSVQRSLGESVKGP